MARIKNEESVNLNTPKVCKTPIYDSLGLIEAYRYWITIGDWQYVNAFWDEDQDERFLKLAMAKWKAYKYETT